MLVWLMSLRSVRSTFRITPRKLAAAIHFLAIALGLVEVQHLLDAPNDGMRLGDGVEDDDEAHRYPFWASQLAITIEASPPSEWPMKMIGAVSLDWPCSP